MSIDCSSSSIDTPRKTGHNHNIRDVTLVLNRDDMGGAAVWTRGCIYNIRHLYTYSVRMRDQYYHMPLRTLLSRAAIVMATPTLLATLPAHISCTAPKPERLVQLYALPPHPVPPRDAWLPPKFKPTDCGKLISIPPGAETFTGVEMKLDGHPVTGVLEMGPYQEKMNQAATDAVGASRLQPIPAGTLPPGYSHNGYAITQQVPNVHLTVGANNFWTGPVQLFPVLDVESMLPPKTPVMLMNLSTIQNVMLFNAVSSGQVCISAPTT